MSTEDAPPKHTLYVQNLNDKIKVDRMKTSLYAAFSQHGKILEVTMCSGRRLRGQAWVTFDDIPSASAALRAMNGFLMFEKPLVIHFAKEEADVIARREGTFKPREKRKLEPAASAPDSSNASATTNSSSSNKRQATNGSLPPPPPPPTKAAPNKILFLQDLPDSCSAEILSTLFKQYHGFQEVRLVPGKKGLAFVEYGDEAQAALALEGLYGFRLTPTDILKVSFAKK
ncbi:hypothetical protein PINS_up012329 [Pythium insidiosum]|nr:hypothetical protein PINS_up012329 [Pythium insidiosum]